MTINATITLARDAYQLAMVELLKAGTLPADLPTRVAWLASLGSGGAPDAVRTSRQSLSAVEQAVAKSNIGASIVPVSDTPQAGAVYDLWLGGKLRVLVVNDTNQWHDGLMVVPFWSVSLMGDYATGWVLFDDDTASTWTAPAGATPQNSVWTLDGGTSPDTPVITPMESTPRLFHHWSTGRTWILASPYGDYFGCYTGAVDALRYTPQGLSAAQQLQARENLGTGSGSDAYATTKLTNAGELMLDDTLTIGDLTYTMVATPSVSGDVLGESGMQPIIDAINGDALNSSHPLVMASDAGGGDMLIQALAAGPEGNGIYVDYSPYGAGTAYWEEGATTGGGNSLLADTMGASSRLSSYSEVEDVATGYLLIQKAQDNVRFVSFSLLLLWAWIKSKLDTALTFAGTKTFTGQVELTGQSATNGTSAMTRNLVSNAIVLDTCNCWSPYGQWRGHAAGGGTLGTNGYGQVYGCRNGTGLATAWARTIISADTTGTQISNDADLCAVPLAVSLVGCFESGGASANGGKLRITVGDSEVTGTAPPLGNAPALAARGFGAETYWSTANSRNEVRLFAHNGTTLVYGTPIAFDAAWTKVTHLIIASNGAGRIQLHMAISAAGVLARPTVQTSATLAAGGPTTGSYGNTGAITVTTVAHGTNVPTADCLYQHKTSMVALNTTL